MDDQSSTPPGGVATGTPSGSSASPSSGSFSSPRPSRVATLSGALVSLTVIAIIFYAWRTGMLPPETPWWGPMGGIVLAAIPGGVLGAQIGTVGKAAVGGLLDRLPKRGAGK